MVESVEVVDRFTMALRTLSAAECEFRYRDSVFKTDAPGRYVITHVNIVTGGQAIDSSYPDIDAELGRLGYDRPNPTHVANAVIRVRRRKLPDPRLIGNVGSFFKNPLVERDVFRRLAEEISAPGFAIGDGMKVPAAYLIDSLGWRERDIKGPVGIWPDHSLVLYNRGGARGKDVLSLSHSVAESVHNQFGIELEREPLVWGE